MSYFASVEDIDKIHADLFKSIVRGHYRKTKRGKVSAIRQYATKTVAFEKRHPYSEETVRRLNNLATEVATKLKFPVDKIKITGASWDTEWFGTYDTTGKKVWLHRPDLLTDKEFRGVLGHEISHHFFHLVMDQYFAERKKKAGPVLRALEPFFHRADELETQGMLVSDYAKMFWESKKLRETGYRYQPYASDVKNDPYNTIPLVQAINESVAETGKHYVKGTFSSVPKIYQDLFLTLKKFHDRKKR